MPRQAIINAAKKPLAIPAFVQQPHVLAMCEDIPPNHKIVIVRQVGFEPFLRLGDYAVVDMANKDLTRQDALYMTWGESPRDGRFLRVVEACIDSYRDGKGGFYDAAHCRDLYELHSARLHHIAARNLNNAPKAAKIARMATICSR